MFGRYFPGKSILRKTIGLISPPEKWRFPVATISAIIIGLGLLILYISNAVSYLSDDPKVCINCHVMNTQYATWRVSSHANKATCNDCHVPHDNIFNKYIFKANDGLRHATIFTLRLEPQVIRIKEAGADVVQQNCIRCHSDRVHDVAICNVTFAGYNRGDGLLCTSCHNEVPHGRVNGLAAVPYARVSELSPVLPEWLEKYVSNEKRE